LRSGLGQTT